MSILFTGQYRAPTPPWAPWGPAGGCPRGQTGDNASRQPVKSMEQHSRVHTYALDTEEPSRKWQGLKTAPSEIISTSVTCPEGLPPAGGPGGPQKRNARLGVQKIVPMAPGGLWDHFPRPECSKRWHGDPFGDIFDFWSIFAQNQCASLLNGDNFCVAQRQA